MKKHSKLYKHPIGAYFYKYEEDELIVLRLYKIKNENNFLFKDKQNNKIALSKEQFEEFTMVKPDGLVIHVLASDPNQGLDTLCFLYKIEDIDNNVQEPYAVCRQNIVDPFEMLLNNDPTKTYVGVSISRDTCPEGYDFKSVCMAAGIRHQRIHFVYKDDSFEDIMSYVNENLFNKTLGIIRDHMDESDILRFIGFKDTYRDLLKENDFMYDFRRAFNIIRINIDIDTSIESWTEDGIYKISNEEIEIIEGITKHEVIAPIVIKYDRTIDIEKIKRSYILFEDSNENIYILSYDKGNYINREYDALEDQRDKELLQKKIAK